MRHDPDPNSLSEFVEPPSPTGEAGPAATAVPPVRQVCHSGRVWFTEGFADVHHAFPAFEGNVEYQVHYVSTDDASKKLDKPYLLVTDKTGAQVKIVLTEDALRDIHTKIATAQLNQTKASAGLGDGASANYSEDTRFRVCKDFAYLELLYKAHRLKQRAKDYVENVAPGIYDLGDGVVIRKVDPRDSRIISRSFVFGKGQNLCISFWYNEIRDVGYCCIYIRNVGKVAVMSTTGCSDVLVGVLLDWFPMGEGDGMLGVFPSSLPHNTDNEGQQPDTQYIPRHEALEYHYDLFNEILKDTDGANKPRKLTDGFAVVKVSDESYAELNLQSLYSTGKITTRYAILYIENKTTDHLGEDGQPNYQIIIYDFWVKRPYSIKTTGHAIHDLMYSLIGSYGRDTQDGSLSLLDRFERSFRNTYSVANKDLFSFKHHFLGVPRFANDKKTYMAEWAAYVLGGFVIDPVINFLKLPLEMLPNVCIDTFWGIYERIAPRSMGRVAQGVALLLSAPVVLALYIVKFTARAALSPVKSLHEALTWKNPVARVVACTLSVIISIATVVAAVVFAPQLLGKLSIAGVTNTSMMHGPILSRIRSLASGVGRTVLSYVGPKLITMGSVSGTVFVRSLSAGIKRIRGWFAKRSTQTVEREVEPGADDAVKNNEGGSVRPSPPPYAGTHQLTEGGPQMRAVGGALKRVDHPGEGVAGPAEEPQTPFRRPSSVETPLKSAMKKAPGSNAKKVAWAGKKNIALFTFGECPSPDNPSCEEVSEIVGDGSGAASPVGTHWEEIIHYEDVPEETKTKKAVVGEWAPYGRTRHTILWSSVEDGREDFESPFIDPVTPSPAGSP